MKMRVVVSILSLKLLHRFYKGRVKEIRGRRFYVCPNVFSPAGTVTGEFLSENLDVKGGDSVLDLGTGSGILAVFAAEKAKKVIATDINPYAVECAKKNARINNLQDKIEVREGDLFKPVENERFDLILFSPPYFHGKPGNILEKAWLDDGDIIKRFFQEAKEHLVERGRIQMVYSTIADVEYLEKVMEKYGFTYEIIARKRIIFETILVYNIWV